MGHHDNCSPLGMKFIQEPQDRPSCCRVEIASGFICKQERGVTHERPSNCNTLLLPAGELAWAVREAVREFNSIEDRIGSSMSLCPRNALIEERHFNILDDRQLWNQIEGLKDEADPPPPNGAELGVFHVSDILAVEQIRALGRSIKTANNIHQRALARTALPHDTHVLPLLDVQIDATQGRCQNAAIGPVVDTVKIGDLDDRLRGHGCEMIRQGGTLPVMNESQHQAFLQAASGHDLVPVTRRVLSDHLTPVLAYRRMVHGDHRIDTSFLLESVEVGGSVGRYSIVAAQPMLEVTAKRSSVTVVDHRNGTTKTEPCEDPLEELRSITDEIRVASCGRDVFRGGWAGWLSYDSVRWLEPNAVTEAAAPTDDRDLPDLHFGLYDTVIVFDHVEKTLSVTCWADLRANDAESALDVAKQTIDSVLERLAADSVILPAGRVDLDASASCGLPGTPANSREQFEDGVERCIEYIRAGDIFQVVPSQRFERVSDVDPFDVYRALRVVNPSPYMIYMQSPDAVLVASSPEILCRVHHGEVTSRPLAGTRPRGEDDAKDASLEQELRADAKECAEHAMLVDLARNDLGTVCEPGSVVVDRLMDVERYSHVMHLSSTVRGQLSASHDCWDALRRSLPVGTVSGAPKIRAMQIIDELEAVRRGPYAGGIGCVSFCGDMDIAIALRTIVVPVDSPGPPWRYHLQAGAGVVLDSVPAREYEETLSKAAALGRAIDLAEAAISG